MSFGGLRFLKVDFDRRGPVTYEVKGAERSNSYLMEPGAKFRVAHSRAGLTTTDLRDHFVCT